MAPQGITLESGCACSSWPLLFFSLQENISLLHFQSSALWDSLHPCWDRVTKYWPEQVQTLWILAKPVGLKTGREETSTKSFTMEQVAWHYMTIKTSIPAVYFYKKVLSEAKEQFRAASQGNEEGVSERKQPGRWIVLCSSEVEGAFAFSLRQLSLQQETLSVRYWNRPT